MQVRGQKNVSLSKVQSYLRTRKGRELDPEMVQSDVRRLTHSGLFRDVRRDDAARFAFLLGTPAFVGAAALAARDLSGLSGRDLAELALGFSLSAAVGFAVIHFLLRYLRTRTLAPFVIYRFAVAALTLVIGAIRVA